MKNSLQLKYLPKFRRRLAVTTMIKYKCEKSLDLYMVCEHLIARSSLSRAITMLVYLDSEEFRVPGQVSGSQTVEFPRERVKFSVSLSNKLWKGRTSPCP